VVGISAVMLVVFYRCLAQAVTMFEENYTYSVIAKKLSHNKGWVSKWTRRWKTNTAESLQSWSRRRLTNKTALNRTAQRIIRKSKYLRGHSLWKLERTLKGNNFQEVGSRYGDSCIRSLSGDVSVQMAESSIINCQLQKARLWKSWTSMSLNTLQNVIGSMLDRLKAVIRNKGDTVPY